MKAVAAMSLTLAKHEKFNLIVVVTRM